MEDTTFTTRQVGELLKIEDTRLKRGESGIRQELQALIDRLKSGGVAGKADNPRVAQAKRLWDLGIGQELGFPNFEKYLATIPRIPSQLVLPDREFPLCVLVEPRLPLKMLCALGNVDFDGDDNTFVPWYPPPSLDPRNQPWPYWIRMQDGRKNRNRSVVDCRHDFAKNELGLTAFEGVSAYIQHPEVVTDLTQCNGHAMDLPGSVYRGDRALAAHFQVLSGRVELNWAGIDDDASSECGSASCRKF